MGTQCDQKSLLVLKVETFTSPVEGQPLSSQSHGEVWQLGGSCLCFYSSFIPKPEKSTGIRKFILFTFILFFSQSQREVWELGGAWGGEVGHYIVAILETIESSSRAADASRRGAGRRETAQPVLCIRSSLTSHSFYNKMRRITRNTV